MKTSYQILNSFVVIKTKWLRWETPLTSFAVFSPGFEGFSGLALSRIHVTEG